MSVSSPNISRASNRPPVLTDPVRYPQAAASPLRTKRALILLLLTVFLPGSAQLVAGNRRLGRAALRVTFTVWLLALAALAAVLLNRGTVLNLFTNPMTSLAVVVVLAALAVGWAFLFLNTLRIIRPGLLAPGVRALTGVLLVVLMVATSGTLGYAAYVINVGRNAISDIFDAAGPAMDPVDGRYNFLVMGGDAGADRVGRRPDSIVVVSVDAKSGQAVTISIPRNLQSAQFTPDSPLNTVYPDGYNCGDNCIINFLYTDVTEHHADLYPGKTDPGAAAMMDAAGGTLGLTIQGYVLVDMEGFSNLIDALGGVKVNAGGWVPISGAAIGDTGLHVPPDGWIAPGEQTLDGFHALWYARSREFVTDYARSQRQQCIQQALLKQMDPATVLTKFESIASAGTKVMESDIPSAQLGSFVDLALKSKQHPLGRLTIGPPDFDINFPTYPDFDQIHARVQQLIASASADAPSTDGGNGTDAASDGGNAGGTAEGGNDSVSPETAEAGTGADPADQVPATADPSITEDYLQRLAEQGNTSMLETLVGNNGTCSAG
jgi:polyisoprenyl-teichoic acid--peptidoglycan teichoic acid transferase